MQKIEVKAGSGGNGAVSFRRENMSHLEVQMVVMVGEEAQSFFVASNNVSTLADFRFTRSIKANNGDNGGIKNMFGAAAEDVYVNVPVGTLVYP